MPDVARANRDFLRGLYAVVKDSDADIRFSLITGVSKFWGYTDETGNVVALNVAQV